MGMDGNCRTEMGDQQIYRPAEMALSASADLQRPTTAGIRGQTRCPASHDPDRKITEFCPQQLIPEQGYMNPTFSPHWYVAQTHPHSEVKAGLHLGRQGFEIYLPRYLKKRRHARRVDTVAAPLYPGYVFVAIDCEVQRWRSIQSTIGVSRLVCHGDEPAAVPAGIVEELKRQQDENGWIVLRPRPRFNAGDSVRVVEGAFSDCLGLYEGIDDRARAAIVLDLLGRKVRVVLPSDLLDTA